MFVLLCVRDIGCILAIGLLLLRLCYLFSRFVRIIVVGSVCVIVIVIVIVFVMLVYLLLHPLLFV